MAKRKPSTEHIEKYYDFSLSDPTVLFPIQLVSDLDYPGLPIPGLLNLTIYSFEAGFDMVESADRLFKKITWWAAQQMSAVTFKVHNAKKVSNGELVHYVELLPSKWSDGTDCPPRDYEEIKNFIKSIPEYQRLPP